MRYARPLAAAALVEWFPQETMLFDGARAAIRPGVALTGDACFIGWDVTHLGRTASGERFASGRMGQTLEIVRDDAMLWCERAVLDGGSRALQPGAILDGAPVFGTMIAPVTPPAAYPFAARGFAMPVDAAPTSASGISRN